MSTKYNEKKLQIFVSSTYTDMLEERQAAIETILKTHNIPAGMELFSSGSESQLEVIKEWIDDSDLYVLILGGRYGSLEPKSQKSYTQLEYEYAVEKGKPYFAVVIEEAFLEEKVMKNGRNMMEYENYQKYQDFRKLVLEKICVFYNSIDNLKFQLSTNIENTAKRYDFPGWIKGKSLSDYIQEKSFVSSEQSNDTNESADRSIFYSAELKELCNMYLALCKPLMFFSETIENEYPVEILNEIRASFDHISRLVITESEIELTKLKEHVYRMCIDSYRYAIVSLNDLFSQFEKNSKNFQNGSSEFFTKYYTLKHEFTSLVVKAKGKVSSFENIEDILSIYELAFNKANEIYMLIGNMDKHFISKSKNTSIWDLRTYK